MSSLAWLASLNYFSFHETLNTFLLRSASLLILGGCFETPMGGNCHSRAHFYFFLILTSCLKCKYKKKKPDSQLVL